VEEFVERTDPRGRKYYWLTGRFENYDEGHDADETALRDGYVSVVPVGFDFTAYQAMAHFQEHYAFQRAAGTAAAATQPAEPDAATR